LVPGGAGQVAVFSLRAHDRWCHVEDSGEVSAVLMRRSSSPSFIRVVEATYLCTLDHSTAFWWLDRPGLGR
jgi:hypothetical protein